MPAALAETLPKTIRWSGVALPARSRSATRAQSWDNSSPGCGFTVNVNAPAGRLAMFRAGAAGAEVVDVDINLTD